MDWDLLGSLYIIPFLVEQKIEACCFGLGPSFCALVLPPVTSERLPSYLLLSGSWPMDFDTG